MKLLEMKNIEKSFGDLQVLKDINLFVEEGEVVSIIGPSGSGKSTLLRCATFLETIDAGSIAYVGQYAAETKTAGRICLHWGAEKAAEQLRPGVSELQSFPPLLRPAQCH